MFRPIALACTTTLLWLLPPVASDGASRPRAAQEASADRASAYLASECRAAQEEPAWDRALQKQVEALAEDWFEARPRTRFEEWDPQRRTALLERAVALGPIPTGAFDAAVELVHEAARASRGKAKKAGRIDVATPFGPAWFLLDAPKEDAGFVLGLHGGGPGVGDANEARGNWPVKGLAAAYPQAVRLDGDAWNTVHGERFALTILEFAKLDLGVDPDRLYSVGFSMGGTGSWFLAGRWPDWLAGAIPAHGVIMAAPRAQLADPAEVESLQHGLLPNVRNLAMYWYTGTRDVNCMPGTYRYAHARLLELAAADPTGYQQQRFTLHEGLDHSFPKGEPAAGLAWIAEQRRDTFPTTVVWEYAALPFPLGAHGDPQERLVQREFYWLECADPSDGMRVRATRDGARFDIAVERRARGTSGFALWIAPSMVPPGTEIVVTSKGEELYRGTPTSSFETLFSTYDARVDRSMVFDRRIEL
jgi:hypothetical protein